MDFKKIAALFSMPDWPSFPADQQLRHHFIGFCAAITQELEQKRLSTPLSAEQLNALCRKLTVYATKQNLAHAQRLQQLQQLQPTIIDALAERPGDILQRRGLAGIIAAHRQRSMQKSAGLRRDLSKSNPDVLETVVVDLGDGYQLVEAATPRHLQKISAALGHCVGTLHNKTALKKAGFTKEDPGAEAYLQYAIQIRKGESRIFSLEKNSVPQATIEYNVKQQKISQIQGKKKQIDGADKMLPALCRAIDGLRQCMTINQIAGLPTKGYNCLMFDGSWLSHHDLTAEKIDQVLTGIVKLSPHHTADDIAIYCACPRLNIDITNLDDLTQLPTIIKASLIYDKRDDLVLLQLEQCGALYAGSASSVVLPQLEQCGALYAGSASSVVLPQLVQCEDFYAYSVSSVVLPQLVQCEDFFAYSVSSVALPQLVQCKNFYALKAEKVLVRRPLKVSGKIVAPNAMYGPKRPEAVSGAVAGYMAGL